MSATIAAPMLHGMNMILSSVVILVGVLGMMVLVAGACAAAILDHESHRSAE